MKNWWRKVAWTLQANHGGGYSYRLCPLAGDGSKVTEACFKRTPLKFQGQLSFRWGGRGGRGLKFNATYVTSIDDGSMWAKNPIPWAWQDPNGAWGKGSNHMQTGEGFRPYCLDDAEDPVGDMYSCTGEWGPYNLEIVDMVELPADLVPGPYVLGFRWDCEESNRIWASCSDVDIVNDAPFKHCGGNRNNYGQELPGMPVPSSSSCACAAICDADPLCEAWNFSEGAFTRGPANCFLRSSYNGTEFPDNCNGECWSGRSNRTATAA